MSAVFEVPCPECGQQLRAAADLYLQCWHCRQTYQLRMGHLFPAAEREAARGSAVPDSAIGGSTS